MIHLDAEQAWLAIDKFYSKPELTNRAKKVKKDKVIYNNLSPLEKKVHNLKLHYDKLNTKYGDEYGSNDGSFECEALLTELRDIETTFRVLDVNIRTFPILLSKS